MRSWSHKSQNGIEKENRDRRKFMFLCLKVRWMSGVRCRLGCIESEGAGAERVWSPGRYIKEIIKKIKPTIVLKLFNNPYFRIGSCSSWSFISLDKHCLNWISWQGGNLKCLVGTMSGSGLSFYTYLWWSPTPGVKNYDCNWLPRETCACSHWDQGPVVTLMRRMNPGCHH